MSPLIKRKNKVKKEKVQKVLRETRDAYSIMCSAHVNTDYADYASTTELSSFQKALRDPELTYDQLCNILRRASGKEYHRQCKTPWSLFMANYIERHSNANSNS